MKKNVLVLSWYFPPCNLTPAERIYSWARYFHENNLYPTIVTRNWDIPVQNLNNEFIATGEKIVHEKNEFYEVYYIPYQPDLKQKLFKRYSGTKFYFLYLAVSFLYSFLENFTSYFTPYTSLYTFARKLAAQTKFSHLLISGSPFHLFKFGYQLNKKYNIPWVADYRDDWNTNEIFVSNGAIKKMIQRLSLLNEKKWVNTASFFTTVSDHYVQKIKRNLHIPGHTILNGFMPENYNGLALPSPTEKFTICYVGSLYESQPIEIFISSVKKMAADKKPLQVKFIGMQSQNQAMLRIKKLTEGIEDFFVFTERLPKEKVIQTQHESDLLLICSHNNIKGTPGSKLYEYIALKKPVLVCPSDRDIIEETLSYTHQGIFAEDSDKCYDILSNLYNVWKQQGNIAGVVQVNEANCDSFSRKTQALKLSKLISDLTEK